MDSNEIMIFTERLRVLRTYGPNSLAEAIEINYLSDLLGKRDNKACRICMRNFSKCNYRSYWSYKRRIPDIVSALPCTEDPSLATDFSKK
jgi:hypothetical protein